LAVRGGFESSRSLIGTNDWTYLTLLFDSGDRTEVELGSRLGHHGSLASGTAWFDDLVLLELPVKLRNLIVPRAATHCQCP
jgi:hypothetical protein